MNITMTTDTPASSGSLLGKLLLGLFLLPFCAVGLFTGYLGIKALLEGNTEEGGMLLLFGLVFGGVGFGGIIVAMVVSKKKRAEEALKTTHAERPWMWRPDWATGAIKSSTKSQIVFFLIFAVLWNLISAPLVVFLPEEIFEKGNTAALLGFLFPLVGIGLIIGTTRMILKRKKFGETIFRMNTIPGVIGGELAGAVEVGRTLTGTVLVRLSNVRRVTTGSGKSRSTNETILWQDERQVVQREPLAARPGEKLPVRFRIPFECNPTEGTDTRNEIVWRLEAKSEEPGIDFSETFDIPVFKTGQSSATVSEDVVAREISSAVLGSGPLEPPPGLEVRPGPEGGTEYVLQARRNLKGSLGLGLFTLIWTGVVVLLFIADAPLIFPVVFGFFEVLLIAGLVSMNFMASSVLVEADAVTVRHRILGYHHGTRLPRESIKRIKVTNSGQSGSTGYWTLEFEQATGKGARLWQMLQDRRQAEYLADQLRRAIGLAEN